MESRHILIIDDEPDLCDILQYNLRTAGYETHAAYSAEDALEYLQLEDAPGDELRKDGAVGGGRQLPDLILLDVMMPGMSGFELATRLKGDAMTVSIPIVFLTAKDTENDMLHGFGIGADDYIRKPFSVREVMARVKAVLSRSQPSPYELGYKGLRINMNTKTAEVDGERVVCTPTEFHLLVLFLQEPGQVFSREQLIKRVWPTDVVVGDRAVDVNITRLRKKIGPYAANIKTRQGFGYYFDML